MPIQPPEIHDAFYFAFHLENETRHQVKVWLLHCLNIILHTTNELLWGKLSWCQYARFSTFVKLKVLERRKSVIASIHLSLKSEQHLGIPLDPVPWAWVMREETGPGSVVWCCPWRTKGGKQLKCQNLSGYDITVWKENYILTFKWSLFPVYTSGLRGLYDPNNWLSNCTKKYKFLIIQIIYLFFFCLLLIYSLMRWFWRYKVLLCPYTTQFLNYTISLHMKYYFLMIHCIRPSFLCTNFLFI